MSKERYVEHTVAWELPNRDSVTKGNYNLADIETKYLPIQTEVVSDSKDHTINELKQRIAELEEQLKNAIVLPCIKKHTTYLDIDSGLVEVAWYVIFKQNGYGDEIFTIKCRSEEDAIKELKELKGE